MNAKRQKIAADVREIISCNDTVIVVHYGDMNTKLWDNIRQKLSDMGMKARVIPSKVSARALDDTPFQNIAMLFNGPTALVFGSFAQTSNLLTCIKMEPKLCLLGGKVFSQLLTPKGLDNVGRLPSLETLQQELSHLLILPQVQHLTYLNSGPSMLHRSLSLRTLPTDSTQ